MLLNPNGAFVSRSFPFSRLPVNDLSRIDQT